MELHPTDNQKNVSTLIHLSTFSKYFIPLGNFLLPLIMWTVNKNHPFINEHGRQAINFQLSVLMYSLVVGIICIPFFFIFASDFVGLMEVINEHAHEVHIENGDDFGRFVILFGTAALLLFGLFVFELYVVISATINAHRGKLYKYPLSIPFIKSSLEEALNQSKNEHVN